MWLLRLLPWCFLLSVVRSADPDCNWKMPQDTPKCTQKIRWKVYNDKQATSTCLEYFPTTFVEGVKDADSFITCTVYRQFQCNFMQGSFPMFDKCYKFLTDVPEKTMEEYKADRDNLCGKDGALPVFFSMSQAKHIGMEAHKQGLNNFWVNVNKTGYIVEQPASGRALKQEFDPNFLLYSEQWKLHADIYWEGEELKMTPKDEKGNYNFPDTAAYLFFRSRTDHLNNLLQGSFERASIKAKASIVCEYQAKIVPDQEKYCAKMQALGINAKYDSSNGRKRCVYTTLSTSDMKGTKEDIQRLGTSLCKEKPSLEHSAGMDDGTANHAIVYSQLTKVGTFRAAAIKIDTSVKGAVNKQYANHIRQHCDPNSSGKLEAQRAPYEVYDHFLNKKFSAFMKTPWAAGYPKDECSDFPNQQDMHSNTLAIRNGELIDVPVSVHFPLLCSIETQVDCDRMKKDGKPICDDSKGEICVNEDTWNEKTKLYASCRCPLFHKYDTDGVCKWDKTHGTGNCGMVRKWEHNGQYTDGSWAPFPIHSGSLWDIWSPLPAWSDHVDFIVVRKGCTATVYSHPAHTEKDQNHVLIGPLTVGEYDVPLDDAGTMNGWEKGMATSALECTCEANPPSI